MLVRYYGRGSALVAAVSLAELIRFYVPTAGHSFASAVVEIIAADAERMPANMRSFPEDVPIVMEKIFIL